MSEQTVSQPQGDHVETKRSRWCPTRRGFLISLGAGGVGVALGVRFGLPAMHLRFAEGLDSGDSSFAPTTNSPLAWFEVLPVGPVLLYVSKVEMGQGIHTALAQIAAEELALNFDQIEVVQAGTANGPEDPFGTAGSTSVATIYNPLREAAATLREMLRAKAVEYMGEDGLVARNGGFEAVKNGVPTRMEYGAIVQREVGERGIRRDEFGEIISRPDPDDLPPVSIAGWEVPETPPVLKPASEFTIIGTSAPRIDLLDKVTGKAVYGYDVRVDGMKYGAVARPPTLGATLRSASAGTAESSPGVIAVVIQDDFAGVVADSRAQAQAALAALDLEWDEGTLYEQADIDAMVTAFGRGGTTIQNVGDAPSALDAKTTLSAEYRTPMAAHASMEPQAAMADVRNGAAELWVSTQMQHQIRGPIAKAIGLESENVQVTPAYVGGGFGRKWGQEIGIEAARLSQAAGVPVHVGWTRAEEMRSGYVRPPTHHVLRASLEGSRITAIEHEQSSGDVAGGFLPGFVSLMMGSDFGAWRGGRLMYDAPNVRTEAWHHELPVATGWWRGLGLLANTFAIESFIDELAASVGVDPVEFRLTNLADDDRGLRIKRVIETAAERGGWGTPTENGRARGFAACTDAGTQVACVAEVSLDEATGGPIVHRVTTVMDCGRVINPDGATAQVEGCVMWGVGSALIEELEIEGGRVKPGNFDGYPLLTIRQAPEVDVVLLETEGAPPTGVGEPPIGPVTAAIGNALFALTGARVRQIPFTAERIAG